MVGNCRVSLNVTEPLSWLSKQGSRVGYVIGLTAFGVDTGLTAIACETVVGTGSKEPIW